MKFFKELLPFDTQTDAYPHQTNLMRVAFIALALFPLMLILKRWIAEFASVFIGLLFLYHSYRMHDWRWAKSSMMMIAWALWMYMVFIVTPLAIDPMESLSRSLIWGRYILFFAAIVFWLSTYKNQMKKMTLWMLVIVGAVTVDTYIQYITGESLTGRLSVGNRLTGPLTRLAVGIFLAKLSFPILGLLLHDAWENNRKKHVVFYFVLVTAMMVAIVLSNERTALITYVLGLALSAVLLFIFLRPVRRLVLIFAAVQMLLLSGLYATQPALQSRVGDSVEMAGEFSSSPYAQLWIASWEMWKRYPIFGVGLKNFRIACDSLIEDKLIVYCNLHPHNPYLEFLSEAGIIGFIGIIALVASFIIYIASHVRATTPNGRILGAFAFAGLLPTFFPFVATQSFVSNWPAMLAWFSIAMSVALASRMRHA
jgi:O-antigen ligase